VEIRVYTGKQPEGFKRKGRVCVLLEVNLFNYFLGSHYMDQGHDEGDR